MGDRPVFGKKGFLWVTLTLFVMSLVGQFVFSWFVQADEARMHGEQPDVGSYLNETLKDMFENWQSEFMQLIWQVVGLSFLWYVGSSQSKEGDDRQERKLDLLMDKVYGEKEAAALRRKLEGEYPKE